MTIIGNPRSFHKKWKYLVEIDSLGRSGWATCSELSVEAAKIEHWEGGARIPNKSVGRLTFSDVDLTRGATRDRDLFDWFQEVATLASGLGLPDDRYKRGAAIVQLDTDGTTLRRWTLQNAWPTKFIAGEWDNDTDEVTMEGLTLTYDYFDLEQR